MLPEYGLTRADARLLRHHAPEIVSRLPVTVAELGTGSGRKTRWLLEALAQRHAACYCPIEISRSALAMCRRELGDIEAINIVGYEGEYLEGLAQVVARRHAGEHLLVLFLGSTIGNFERPAAVEFLREVRCILRHGDSLLLGTDFEKPVAQLLAAYDDPLGITAAFNLNLLARLNRERGGTDDHVTGRRDDLDEELPQIHVQGSAPARPEHRIPLRGTVARPGMAIRGKPANCCLTVATLK